MRPFAKIFLLTALLFSEAVIAQTPFLDPRDSYLNCRSQGEACYQSDLDQALKGEGTQDDSQISSFKTENPFSKAAKETTDLYLFLFSAFEPRVEKAAFTRWGSCRELFDPVGPKIDPRQPMAPPLPTGFPYAPEDYLSPPILDCINSQATQDLDSVRESLSGKKFEVTNEEARNLIRDLFLPKYLEILKTEYTREHAEEETALENKKPSVKKVILEALMMDMSWSESVKGKVEFQEKCEPRAKIGFNEYQRKVKSSSQIPLRLHAPWIVRDAWAKEFCEAAYSLMEEWKASLVPMVDAVRTGLKHEGYECREKMGLRGGGVSFRSLCPAGPGYLLCWTRLKACIRLAWPKVEPGALQVWKDSEFGKENRYLMGAAERYLKKQKDRLEFELTNAEPDKYDQEE